MNVFIDVGAFNGDTVEEFKNWSKIAFPDKEEWKIYAFEPNPKFLDYWNEQTNAEFINKAVWVEDTELEFAVDQSESPQGSTLMKGKKAIWDTCPKVKVQALDFSEWLKQFADDYVVIKLDCEGAEYPVLEKMIKDETITIPEILMVEFHPNKVVEYTSTYTNELRDTIRKLNVRLVDWH
jgi:FkbM family methyltransferase